MCAFICVCIHAAVVHDVDGKATVPWRQLPWAERLGHDEYDAAY